jgi:uncharacterized protein (TIGR03067 family)
MMLVLTLVLSVGPGFPTNALNDDTVQKELQKLQGTWTVVSAQADGQKQSEESLKGAKLTVSGDKYTVTRDGRVVERGTLRIDPAQRPKTIDATPAEGEYKGKTFHGIYEVNGDTARDCFAPPGQERPKEFTSKAGSGVVVRTYKRSKR